MHILGMLSNLFSTLDISTHSEVSEGDASLRLSPSQRPPNPVSLQEIIQSLNQILMVLLWRKWEQSSFMMCRLWLSSSKCSLWFRPSLVNGFVTQRWWRYPFIQWWQLHMWNQCICINWDTPFFSSQAVCGVFDKSVRTLLYDFGPMVPQLCEMLGQMYGAFPQASALNLARQVTHLWTQTTPFFSIQHAFVTQRRCVSDGSHFCWRGASPLRHQGPH